MTLPPGTADLIDSALREDIGSGDWTSLWTVPAGRLARARIVSKAKGVIAGADVAAEVFRRLDSTLNVDRRVSDGQQVVPGEEVIVIHGAALSILAAERVALNFLGHLSGVATATRQFVDAIAGTGARILDTRKTTPTLRALEKAAVTAGGGVNHRAGLYDMVLIKENHIAAAGGIEEALRAVHRQNNESLLVEIETTDMAEVAEALAEGVDRILFDNMPIPLLREAVARVRQHPAPRPDTEASGGVSLDTVRKIAETGVDYISVGSITHSAPTLDLSLLLSAVDS